MEAAIVAGLEKAAVVLVVGPHGCGKTRACERALALLAPESDVVAWDPLQTGLTPPRRARREKTTILFVDDLDVAIAGVKGAGPLMIAGLRSLGQGVKLLATSSPKDRVVTAITRSTDVLVLAVPPPDVASIVRSVFPDSKIRVDNVWDVRAALLAAAVDVRNGPDDDDEVRLTFFAKGDPVRTVARTVARCAARSAGRRMEHAAEVTCDATLAAMAADVLALSS